MSDKEVLEYYLSKKHSSEIFAEQEKEYILRYSFKKEKATAILESFGWIGPGVVTKYESENEHVKCVVAELQTIHDRFKSLKQRCEKFEGERQNPFANSFTDFLEWWCNEIGKDGLRRCCYCGVDETTLRKGFELKIRSKKFTETLQIERMDSEGPYRAENCHFACPICNNAKSDMISEEDFETFFAPGIKMYWTHIKDLLGE